NQNDYPQALFLLWKSQCNPGVAADRASVSATSEPTAHAALNNMCTSHGATYYAETLLYNVVGLVGRVVQVGSLVSAGAAAIGSIAKRDRPCCVDLSRDHRSWRRTSDLDRRQSRPGRSA